MQSTSPKNKNTPPKVVKGDRKK